MLEPRPENRAERAPLRRYLSLSGRYLGQIVKTRMHYRGDFLVGCATSLLRQASGLLVIGIIFANTPALRGWNRNEVLFIYGFAVTAQALFEAVADGFYWFSERYILRGELDRILLRPLNPLFQILLENFKFDFLPDLLLGLGILIAAGSGLELPFGVGRCALLCFMLVSAAGVLLGVFLGLSSICFWVEDKVGILPPVYNLMSFGRYPITIYHPVLRVLLSWVLPYGFVAFYPATGFLVREEFAAYFWATPLASVVCLGLGYAVFRAGIRRYRSTGS